MSWNVPKHKQGSYKLTWLYVTKQTARVAISQIQTKITLCLIKNNMELNLPCCFSLADRSRRSGHSWFI